MSNLTKNLSRVVLFGLIGLTIMVAEKASAQSLMTSTFTSAKAECIGRTYVVDSWGQPGNSLKVGAYLSGPMNVEVYAYSSVGWRPWGGTNTSGFFSYRAITTARTPCPTSIKLRNMDSKLTITVPVRIIPYGGTFSF